jgi:hypothetical protein
MRLSLVPYLIVVVVWLCARSLRWPPPPRLAQLAQLSRFVGLPFLALVPGAMGVWCVCEDGWTWLSMGLLACGSYFVWLAVDPRFWQVQPAKAGEAPSR